MREAAKPDVLEGHLQRWSEAGTPEAVLEAASEALGAAFMLLDQTDSLAFASRNIRQFFPVGPELLQPGTRLRDLLGGLFDAAAEGAGDWGGAAEGISREDWITSQVSLYWRERSDHQARGADKRWLRQSQRRLPSGYGLCMITDVTEQKKRDDQWRADLERVQITEAILDNLPDPLFVQDDSLTLVATNRAFARFLSRKPESLLGGQISSVLLGNAATRLTDASRHTLRTGSTSVLVEQIDMAAGEPRPVLVRSCRVGNPGRYFVVTTLDDLAELHDLLPANGEALSQHHRQSMPSEGEISARSLPGELSNRRILLVTGDAGLEVSTLERLSAMGAECCAVRNVQEEKAFFGIARSSKMTIDLVLIDSDMDIACLEIAQSNGHDVLALDAFQFTTELAPSLRAHFADPLTEPSGCDEGPDPLVAPEENGAVDRLSAQEECQNEGSERQTPRPLVLVAEDDMVNRVAVSQILESLGYPFQLASTGDEAVRLWHELKPGIILMDVTLPVLSGPEASRIIRELGGNDCGNVPIIGLVVESAGDRQQCLDAGMDETLCKPLSPEAIVDAFAQFLAVGAMEI